MLKKSDVFKCESCGNIIEILHGSDCIPTCCGKEMKLLTENTVDASKEKHIPVIEKTDKGILVKIGSIPHPMEEKHFIEWIELITEDSVYRKFLKPGDSPEALFEVKIDKFTAREYCNLHGLWKA